VRRREMFTGIIEELGMVRRPGSRLEITASKVSIDSEPGASVAVNGVCLTVTHRRGDVLGFDLSEETVARSSLGRLAEGDRVNLERPVTLLTRLGGHLVQGHVDGVGEVASVEGDPLGSRMRVRVPDDLRRFVVEKGSIAVDGVSLTVTDVADSSFGMALVPFTLQATTLGAARVGDLVNLEADVVAKYVEGFLRRDV
jgi:riboflavin synthase